MQMLRSIAAAVPFCLAATAQIAIAPCWETNLGTNLALGDDAVSGPQSLGFTFPGPSGPVTQVWVSSNGFIWLAASIDSRCCSGDPTWFVTDPASIAAMWMDLYPPGGTGVFFNSIAGGPGVPSRAIVTWQAVPEYGGLPIETVQVQLLDTGAIVISHDVTNGIDPNTGHTAIVGVTQGNNATPNAIDFLSLAGTPANTGTNPTAYEFFGPASYDIAGRSFEFIPNGTGGYLVFERVSCRAAGTRPLGSGCLRNGTVYESFVNNVDLANSSIRFMKLASGYISIPGGGFDNTYASVIAGTGDDSIHQGLPLGFSFSYQGATITTVDLSSNGYLWTTTNSASVYYPTILDYLQSDPRIAPYWRDLYVPGGGAIYWDQRPGFAMATWVGVPNYPNTGPTNDVQVKLFATGDIEFSYGNLDTTNPTTSDITVVGFTEGLNAVDPGSSDLTASMPGLTVGMPGAVPLRLDPAAGSLPRIGSSFTMETQVCPATVSAGFMLFSFGNVPQGADLSVFGLPFGCTGYIVLAGSASVFFPITPPVGSYTMSFPNNPGFVGVEITAQSLVLPVPGAPLPGLVSNGLILSIGV